MQRYDMVFAVGTDIMRQFNFDVNALGDRGLLDHTFKMQVRSKTGDLIADFNTGNGKIIVQHSRIFISLQETEQFDLAGLEFDYVTEPVPSPECPTTGYLPFAYYDLVSVSPDGVYTRELHGRIGFDAGITRF